jgi:hypothetical protein
LLLSISRKLEESQAQIAAATPEPNLTRREPGFPQPGGRHDLGHLPAETPGCNAPWALRRPPTPEISAAYSSLSTAPQGCNPLLPACLAGEALSCSRPGCS